MIPNSLKPCKDISSPGAAVTLKFWIIALRTRNVDCFARDSPRQLRRPRININLRFAKIEDILVLSISD